MDYKNSFKHLNLGMVSHLKNVVYLSLVFLCFQAIVKTLIDTVSELINQNERSWLKIQSSVLLFLGCGLGSLYTGYLKKYSYRIILTVASFGYFSYIGFSIVFITAGLSPLFQAIILTINFIAGAVLSALYNAQFVYLNVCSKKDQQYTKYFGVNLGIVQSSNLLGSSISVLLIQPLGKFWYAVVMEGVAIVISIFYLGVKDLNEPYLFHDQLHQQIQAKVCSNQQVQRYEINRQSVTSNTKNIQQDKVLELDHTVSANSSYSLMFCYIFTGIILTTIYVELQNVMHQTFYDIGPIELSRLTFILLTFQGIGQLLGGLYMVLFSSKFRSIALQFILAGNLFLLAVAGVYMGKQLRSQIVIYLSFLLIGIADCVCFSLNLSMAGNWNEGGISIFNMAHFITIAISVILVFYYGFYALFVGGIMIHCLAGLYLLESQVIK